jgi:hypothetical protein
MGAGASTVRQTRYHHGGMHVYLRLLRYLAPYRGRVLLGLLCLLVATPLSLVHPWASAVIACAACSHAMALRG